MKPALRLALLLGTAACFSQECFAKERDQYISVAELVQEQLKYITERRLAACRSGYLELRQAIDSSMTAFNSRIQLAAMELKIEPGLDIERKLPAAYLGAIKLGLYMQFPDNAPAPPKAECEELIADTNGMSGAGLKQVVRALYLQAAQLPDLPSPPR